MAQVQSDSLLSECGYQANILPPESSQTTRRAQHHQAQPSPPHLPRKQPLLPPDAPTRLPLHVQTEYPPPLDPSVLPRLDRRILAREDWTPELRRVLSVEEIRGRSRSERVDGFHVGSDVLDMGMYCCCSSGWG